MRVERSDRGRLDIAPAMNPTASDAPRRPHPPFYALDEVLRTAVDARRTTPAEFDRALAAGDFEAVRAAIMAGAAVLAAHEFRDGADGQSLAILDRCEEIAEGVAAALPARLATASSLEFAQAPALGSRWPAVVYAATGSTGAAWADRRLARSPGRP
jgi:hypothetical protein